MLSPCDLVCQCSKCIECDNKIFNLICILKREAVENEEGARRRREVMFSMSSDVMRKVCVKFMKIQDINIKVLNVALVD